MIARIVHRSLHHLFWLLIFLVFPLMHNPYRLPTIDEVYLNPKAALLGVIWLLGTIIVLSDYSKARFSDIPNNALLRIPKAVLLMFASVLLLVASGFWGGLESVAWIGSRERLDGVLVQAGWYGLAILTFLVYYKGPVRASRLISVAALGGFLVSVWLLLEAYGYAPAIYIVERVTGTNRPVATMGNEGLVAGYLAVILSLVSTYQLVRMRYSLWTSAIVSGVLMAGIVATGNRASLAAVLMVFVTVLIVRFSKDRIVPWRGSITIFLACVAAATAVTTTLERNYQLGETLKAVRGSDRDTSVRFIFWQIGLDIATDHPWVGVGPNGFASQFWSYTSEEQRRYLLGNRLPENVDNVDYEILSSIPLLRYRPAGEETFRVYARIHDKAHNYFLDLAIASGFPTLLMILLSVFAGLIFMLRSSSEAAFAVSAGVVTYGVFGMAWFATLAVDPIVWSLFGVGLASAWQARKMPA